MSANDVKKTGDATKNFNEKLQSKKISNDQANILIIRRTVLVFLLFCI